MLIPQQKLFLSLVSETNLRKAWIKARFYASTSLPYFDQTAYSAFERHLEANLTVLSISLNAGEYHFSPLRVFEIPKGKETRKTYFERPEDALVAHALLNVIGPLFENDMSNDSFGHRLNLHDTESKDTFRAWPDQFNLYVEHVRSILKETDNVWYQVSDFSNYYPSIDRAVLKGLIPTVIQNFQILTLLDELLERQAYDKNEVLIEIPGLPPGPVYAHYFANVYLVEFDQFMERKSLHYYRYVDDFCFACGNEQELRILESEIREFFAARSEKPLRLNENKTRQEPITNAYALLEHTSKLKYDLRFGAIRAIDKVATDEQIEEAERKAETLFRSLFIRVEKAEDLDLVARQSAGFIGRKLQDFIISPDEALNIAYGILELNPPRISAIRALLGSVMEISFQRTDLKERLIEFTINASDIIKISFLQLLAGFHEPPAEVFDQLVLALLNSDDYLIRANVYLALNDHNRSLSLPKFRKWRQSEVSEYSLGKLTICITLIQKEKESLWVEIVTLLSSFSIEVFNATLLLLIELLESESIPIDTLDLVYPTIQQRIDKDELSYVSVLYLACRFGNYNILDSAWRELQEHKGEHAYGLMHLTAFEAIQFYVSKGLTKKLFRFSDSLAKLGLADDATIGFQELAQSADVELQSQAAERRSQLNRPIAVPGLPEWYTITDCDKGLYCGLSEEPHYRCRYFHDPLSSRTGTLEIVSKTRIESEPSFGSLDTWNDYLNSLCDEGVTAVIESGILTDGSCFALYEIPPGYLPLSEWQTSVQFRNDEEAILEIASELAKILESTKLSTGFYFVNASSCNVLWNPATKNVLVINIGSGLGVPKYVCGLRGCNRSELQREIGNTVGSYFVGLLLLQLLSNKCAIKQVHTYEIVDTNKHTRSPIASAIFSLNLTPHLRSIISRLLDDKPEYRYLTLSVVVDDIGHISKFRIKRRKLAEMLADVDSSKAVEQLTLVDYVSFRMRISRRNPSMVREAPIVRAREILQRLSRDLDYYDSEQLHYWNTQSSWRRNRKKISSLRDWLWLQPEAKYYLSAARGWADLVDELNDRYGFEYSDDLQWLLAASALYEESRAAIHSILLANSGHDGVAEQCATVIDGFPDKNDEFVNLKLRISQKPGADLVSNFYELEHVNEALQIVTNSLTRPYWHLAYKPQNLASILAIVVLFCTECDFVDDEGYVVNSTSRILNHSKSSPKVSDLWITMKQPVDFEQKLKQVTKPSSSPGNYSDNCWFITSETIQLLHRVNICTRTKGRLTKYSGVSIPREGRVTLGWLPWSKSEVSFRESETLHTGNLLPSIGSEIRLDVIRYGDGPRLSSVFGEPQLFSSLFQREVRIVSKFKQWLKKSRNPLIVFGLIVILYIVTQVLGVNGPEKVTKLLGVSPIVGYVLFFLIWIPLLVVGNVIFSFLQSKFGRANI